MASNKLFRFSLLICLAMLAACGGGHTDAATPGTATAPPAVTALQSTELKPGSGAVIALGQTAVVQYTGWLYDAAAKDNKGKQFDSSRGSGRDAFKFLVGTGSVIKGWDQGVVGMKVGESRRLVIPPNLAYGDKGAGGVIPPGATLVFDVELIGIE
jgi:FKBP-type peptidyl-prolyl cis-trans isomerase FkpA